MATEFEIISHEKVRQAFDEALKKALIADPGLRKAINLPGITKDCRLDIAWAVKNAHDWDEDSTAAHLEFTLRGVISGQVIEAEGSAKLRGLMSGWKKFDVNPDYAVGMPYFENVAVRATVTA